jgi:N-acetylglucosamine-6-sulfatase
LLQAAGATPMSNCDGISVWDELCRDKSDVFADRIVLYEYYWERNYPHTPTLHAILGSRFKYIRCHGLWDRDELYDLENDPNEMNNLIHDPVHQNRIEELNEKLWTMMRESDAMEMPLLEDRGSTFPWRHPAKSDSAPYPAEYFRRGESK